MQTKVYESAFTSGFWLTVWPFDSEMCTIDSVAFSQSYEWDTESPIIYSYVRCGGWEDNLEQCGKSHYLDFTCSSNTVAGTLCGYCKSCDHCMIMNN